MELACGAERSRAPERDVSLATEFLATVPIAGLNQTAALEFDRRKARLECTDMRVADAELLIAATALACGAGVVTGTGSTTSASRV